MRQVWILARNTWKEAFRKKDFYVFFIFLFALLVVLSFENFFNIPGISRYIKDLGFSLVWIFSLIIAITFSAKQIPSELETHTIYPLLSKPITRIQVILGKFFGAGFGSVLAFSVFYVLLAIVSYLKGEGIGPALFIESYICGALFLFLISAISICLSIYMTLSANITISFILYFFIVWFGDRLRTFLVMESKVVSFFYNILYYLIPHFEFYDMRVRVVHSWEPLPLGIISAIFLYTVFYISLILWVANAGFRKKRL